MPFGYSDKIFRHPAVQYIPLQLYDNKQGKYPYQEFGPGFEIYRNFENNSLNKKLNKLNLLKENYIINNKQLALLVINAYIDLIKYRGYQVFMVGRVTPGVFQLFKITTKYFYKDNIIFTLYNGANSKKIAQERYN